MHRRLFEMIVAGVTLAAFPALGFANAADPGLPEPPPSQAVPFKITADRRTKENRLIIPRKFLQNAGVRVGLLDEDNSRTKLRTVVAGLAISVSLISLVFLLIRKKSRAAQAAALLLAVGSAGFLCMNEATADIAPPISEIPQAWRRVAEGQQNVKIEITDKGDAVELIVGTYYQRSLPPEERRPEPKPPEAGNAPPQDPGKP